MKVRLHEMRWPEIQKAQSKPDHIVILPLGSVEQHGTHLPVNVDSATSAYLSEKAAEKAAKEHGIAAIVAPTIHYTDVSIHKMFPGTTGVKTDTLISVITDIVESLLDNGFKKVLVMNSHRQNDCSVEAALRIAADRRPGASLFGVDSIDLGIVPDVKTIKAGLAGMGHALEVETSQSLVEQPENVCLDKAEIGSRKLPLSEKFIGVTGMSKSKGILYHPGSKGFEKTGTFGDPCQSSREFGEKVLAAQVDDLAELIVQIVKGTPG